MNVEDEVTAPDGSPEEPLGSDMVALLVEHHRAFRAFLEKRVGRRDIAEDLLQEAFARGLDTMPAFASEESAVAWFYRVLRNAVIDHHRRGGTSDRAL